jgi:predicted outer membrane repeat protein
LNSVDSKFYNNTSGLGGAIYISSNGQYINSSGDVFRNNRALSKGGAIYM